MSDTRWSVTPHPPVPSVFPQPELAYQVMRAFAMKCDERKSGRRCKSCGFLLRAMWDRWFDFFRMRPLVWRVVHCERCGDVLECRRIGAE